MCSSNMAFLSPEKFEHIPCVLGDHNNMIYKIWRSTSVLTLAKTVCVATGKWLHESVLEIEAKAINLQVLKKMNINIFFQKI